MFAAFFYLLRQRGLNVSLNEWMTLLEGMEKGLHRSSLTGFYHLCRSIVVKSEVEFDRFDQVFLEFFKDIPFKGDLPEEMLEWLEHPSEDLKRTIEELKSAGFPDESMEELLKLPGVGRKTANLIRGDIFGKPAIVCDTHCIRLSNRLGFVKNEKDPVKVENALRKLLDPAESSDFCHRLVYHGREVCTARTKPYCDRCCLNDICPKIGV